jgi:hypothetical protein
MFLAYCLNESSGGYSWTESCPDGVSSADIARPYAEIRIAVFSSIDAGTAIVITVQANAEKR